MCSFKLLKLKRDTIPSAGENVKQLQFSYTAIEIINWYNHFGKLVVYLLKVNIDILKSSNSIPKRTCSPEDMYTNVHSSIVYDSLKLKTNNPNVHQKYYGWINFGTHLQYMYIIFYTAMKMNDILLLHHHQWISKMLRERSQFFLKHILHDSIYMEVKNRKN